MICKFKTLLLVLLIPIQAFPAADAYAAHPLITDDTGTQGKGKTQIEFNGQCGWDKETGDGIEVKVKAYGLESVLSHGLIDSLDAVLTLPYSSVWETTDGVSNRQSGLNDVSAGVKWRFWEKEGLSLGFKPAVIFPAGNEDEGFGAGKYGFSTFLIATQVLEPWVFHLNAGYIRNNNRLDERESLYHVSLATEYRIGETLRIVGNIGQDQNTDKSTDRKPAFALAGLIYEFTEDIDIDAGFKAGLNSPETDYTILAGLAWRF